MAKDTGHRGFCASCGIDVGEHFFCGQCGAAVSLPSGVRIEVFGANAEEVEQVARTLAEDAHGRDMAEQFMATVEAKINDPATPQHERGRLQRLRDSAAGVSRDVFADIVAKLVEHQAGL